MPSSQWSDLLKRVDRAHHVLARMPWAAAPVRLASSSAYRLAEVVLGRRHPHTRFVQDASQLSSLGLKPGDTDGQGQSIAFFTVRGWFAHVATETLLAKALADRGYAPSFFLCGGVLPQCDFSPPSDPHPTRPLCWRCTSFPIRLLKQVNLPMKTASDFVDVRVASQEARSRVADADSEELFNFEYAGMPLGRYVVPSVRRTLLKGHVGTDKHARETMRSFVASACVMADVATKFMDDHEPDVVVMSNGLFFAERIVLEVARSRDCRVITYERGILPNTIIVSVGEPVVPFKVDPYWELQRSQPLSETERAQLQRELDRREGGDLGVPKLWLEMETDVSQLCDSLGLSEDVPTTLLFTNILWDTAVFERDCAFDGMLAWVIETIEVFRGLPDQQLVVRIHPAEIRLPMEESKDRVEDRIAEQVGELPDNVHIVRPESPASSYTLIELASRIMTYTSTIGLEAAVRGKRVIVAGDVHYARRGFTVDIEERHELTELLRDNDTFEPLTSDEVELASRYAYAFFFRFMRPFRGFNDRGRHDRELVATSPEGLAHGSDPVFDEICDLVIGRAELPLTSSVQD